MSVTNPKAARPSKARANKTLRRNGEFGELAPRNMLALCLRIIDHHPHGNNVHEVLVPGQGVMKVGIEHITFYENESTTPMLYDADDPLTTNDIDKDVKGLRMQYERNKAEAKSKVSNRPEHNEAPTDDDLTALLSEARSFLVNEALRLATKWHPVDDLSVAVLGAPATAWGPGIYTRRTAS